MAFFLGFPPRKGSTTVQNRFEKQLRIQLQQSIYHYKFHSLPIYDMTLGHQYQYMPIQCLPATATPFRWSETELRHPHLVTEGHWSCCNNSASFCEHPTMDKTSCDPCLKFCFWQSPGTRTKKILLWTNIHYPFSIRWLMIILCLSFHHFAIWRFPMVSWNRGTPKSSILILIPIINHPFCGSPFFWKAPYFAPSPMLKVKQCHTPTTRPPGFHRGTARSHSGQRSPVPTDSCRHLERSRQPEICHLSDISWGMRNPGTLAGLGNTVWLLDREMWSLPNMGNTMFKDRKG